MDFFPRIEVTVGLDREVAILLALLLVVLTGGAQLNMLFDVGGKRRPMKMLGDGLDSAGFTRMSEH